jgi:Kef-type K+ transport system membrane component KefB
MRRALLALALLAAVALVHPGLLAGRQEGEPPPAAAEGAGGEEDPGAGAAAEPGAAEPGAAAAGEHAAGGQSESHGGPVVKVLLGLVVILAAAKLGGEIFERIGQPAVLGELLFGIILGNLALVGVWLGDAAPQWLLAGLGAFDFLSSNLGIEILAQLGVMVLLFEVGLESNVREMLSVGLSSLLVAVLGVVAPFFLGWGVSAWLLPEEELLVHMFIGATLCATSVGITARVLTDLGKLQTRESKIVLGAAVIDDVLGLVILAVVVGIIGAANTGLALEPMQIGWIGFKALAFVVGAIVIGSWLSPRMFRLASRLRIRHMLLTVALVFLFTLAYLADVFGLATIVGAFAAGLILDELHYKDFIDRGEHRLEDAVRPIAVFLVPIFFVWIGTQVDISVFGQTEILGFAALLTLAAIVGKMICAAGVVERGLDRTSVAVGMVPRGEVGLIFASIGAGLVLHGDRVINASVFGAVVIMVIVTTLITPPALKVTLARGDHKKAARHAAASPPAQPAG